LTSEQEMIQRMVREFAEKEFSELSVTIDKGGVYPTEALQKVSPLGLMGLFIPQEYGGAGADTVSYVLSIEEIAKVCASTATILAVHNSLVCATLNKFGNEEQKKKFLAPLAQEGLGAFIIAEPDEIKVTPEGDEYLLNGSKKYVTSGGEAEYYLMLPTEGDKCFIVSGDADGLSFGDAAGTIGLRGAVTRPVIFDGVKVPGENLIEGDGMASYALDEFHIAIAAVCAGISRAALEHSVDYSLERNQFGMPIAFFQAIKWKLARMYEKAQTSEILALEAARAKDEKMNFSDKSKVAKLYASEAVTWVAKQGVLIHGGTGYTREVPLERYARDARAMPLIGGNTESILDSLAAGLFD